MENQKLNQLLEDCLQLADENDKKIIESILTGVKEKLESENGTYIGHILQMKQNHEVDTFELTLQLSSLVNNNLDILHGGITATILDTAMGTMVNRVLPEGQTAVTNQLNIHYLAPGIGSQIACKAKIVHQGSKTMVMEAEVQRDDGKKIAHATGTFFIIKK
ncbi:PaaI family thioesterase [Mesobacillus maritimus]|uniref:PaaI family thioesterase n=1 Tax=Mesobacillus maritimus TaxID=1643336 RepID=UPI00384BFFED